MIFQGAATAMALPTIPSAAAHATAVALGGVAAEHAHAQSYHYHAGQLPHHDNNNSMMLTELQSAYNQTPVSSTVAPTSNGAEMQLTKSVRPACFTIFMEFLYNKNQICTASYSKCLYIY